MAETKIEVVNAPEVVRALGSIEKRAKDISDPTRTVLGYGLDAARGAAPFKTGKLVGDLDIEDVNAEGGVLASHAPYSPAQEFGTRYVRGRRFMARGAKAIEDHADDVFKAWMQDGVDRAADMA